MWICLNDAFFSVVLEEENSDILMVRSRARKHLEESFPDYYIYDHEGTDYPYRIFIRKQELKRFLNSELDKLNYTNFKKSVTDKNLSNFYNEVWYHGIVELEDYSWWEHYRYQSSESM